MEASARGRWLPVAAAAACVLGCGLAQPQGLPPARPPLLEALLGAPLQASLTAFTLAVSAWACAGPAPRRSRRRAVLASLCLLTGAGLLGASRAPDPDPPRPPDRRPAALLARVVRPAPDGSRWMLVDRLRAPDGRPLDRPRIRPQPGAFLASFRASRWTTWNSLEVTGWTDRRLPRCSRTSTIISNAISVCVINATF